MTTAFSTADVMPMIASLQTQRYREMSPIEKLAIADGMWELACEATKAGVRMRFPDLDDAAIAVRARAILREAAD